MANERIRIDNLPSTSFPDRAHLLAAIKDGLTVRLTVAQILSLLQDGDMPSGVLMKAGGSMTGTITFADDGEGITLSRGGKLYDQNTGGTSNAGRTLILANNGSFSLLNEGGTVAILEALEAASYPTFKGNAIWHDGNPALAGMVAAFDRSTAPTGWLKCNGALLTRTAYPNLDAAIYCGDANNATAEWGYRTNSTDTVRSTTGTHIRLRDYRGEFIRGWDDGRGVDSGRSLWVAQAQSYQSHNHSVSDPLHSHQYVGGPNAAGSGTAGAAGQSANAYILNTLTAATGISVLASGSTETRPRNQAALICIKY